MSKGNMQIQFLGAAQTVTGSKYLLTIDDKKILIDCGLYQGLREYRRRNWDKLPIDPAEVDAVVLTHAHIDHSGYLPLFIRNGFEGSVYCTDATEDLCKILLPDSGYLQEEEAARANRYGYTRHKPARPLYTQEDAYAALEHLVPCVFNEDVTIADDIKVRFNIGGHILGASTVSINSRHGHVLFSGDLGRQDDPITYKPAAVHDVHYLITESTYGDRLHKEIDPMQVLEEVINKVHERGGTLVIPAFAVGRTQHIMYYIYELKKANRIPNIPVFLDSPMATNVTKIFLKCPEEHRLTAEEAEAVCSSVNYSRTVDESKALDVKGGSKVIISASGMATGGRVLHHIRFFGGDPKNVILFVGYQAPGTRGNALVNGLKHVRMFGEDVEINAEVLEVSNMSAHADYSETIAWLKECDINPRKVFVTHGESNAAHAMRDKLKEQFNWPEILVPEYLDVEKM